MNKRKKSKTTIPIDTESLLEIMNNQGITRYQLYKLTRIPNQTIYQIFTDKQASAKNIERIAEVLGISPLTFLNTTKDFREVIGNQTYTDYRAMAEHKPAPEQIAFANSVQALNDFMNNVVFVSETGEKIKVPENLMIADMDFYNYMRECALRYIQERHGGKDNGND